MLTDRKPEQSTGKHSLVGLNRTASKRLFCNRCISSGNGSVEKESINVLMVLVMFFQFFK